MSICIECKSENVEAVGPESSMEMRRCLDCGHEFYVHCIYPIPDEYKSKHRIFRGYYIVKSQNESLKAFIKLKGILKEGEYFQLAHLEKQKLEGSDIWDLGRFLDHEIDKINLKCTEQKITVEFVEIK